MPSGIPSQTAYSELSLPSNQTGKESVARSSRKAPKLMKSPFPDEFCLPSPATSSKKSASRASIKRERDEDGRPGQAQAHDPTPAQASSQLREQDVLDDFFREETEPMQAAPGKMGKVGKTTPAADALVDELEKELQEYEHPLATAQKDTSKNQPKNKDQLHRERLAAFEESFVIPALPAGRTVEFNVLQTWGDINYLGLTGIEIFDGEGRLVQIDQSKDITANPSDINLLMGYGNDPRTVDKLVDGTCFTQDDFHAWMTPFTQGEDHTIAIKLPSRMEISMIRIWNYNKSRIHSHRGARLMTCHLDGRMVFRGEIRRAPGNTNDPEQCCEIILFTDSEEIFQKIDANDWLNQVQLKRDPGQDEVDGQREEDLEGERELNRPMTATKRFGPEEVEELQRALEADGVSRPTSMFDERPQTTAIRTAGTGLGMLNYQNEFNEADNEANLELDEFKPQ